MVDDVEVTSHARCFGRHQMIFDPWHYLPVLEIKPGALRNGAPFVDWDLPKALLTLKKQYLKRDGGDREFVQLLLLIHQHGLETVTVACECVFLQPWPPNFTKRGHLHQAFKRSSDFNVKWLHFALL